MLFTAVAFATAALFSPLALAQLGRPGTSPSEDSIASADYCQCVGSFAFPDESPNQPLTELVCIAFQGNRTDVDGYAQCFGVSPPNSGFSNFCASYGDDGARGARCCSQGQAYKDCHVIIPGINGK
ncbi:hypothetical protein CBER1_03157 [Cercospora berteroae]|uniref:Hydrophobin n=1 Tax=Cercospora berteroae TaxID=357750 RepID=A0A2S6CLB1_9PEZI|nr:hypothetical protein CBER1_03157 [Cercospora berteroae]